MNDLIYGRNPVMEVLKSGREIEKILLQKGAEGSVKKIEGMAKERKIPIQYLEKVALDRLAGTGSHQGVAVSVSAHAYCDTATLLTAAAEKGEAPFLILLDGLEDPHNLGAILRTADGAGAHGVIVGKHRAVGLTGTVAKASAGAIEYVPVARAANLVKEIEELKKAGLWICGCDMDGETYWEKDLTGPIALVVGGEGQGISRLVREHCDFTVSIPMEGEINSLNASNAAAVLMYEVNRQRAVSRQTTQKE